MSTLPNTPEQAREHLQQAHRAQRCCHIKPNGLRCGSPAMRRNTFCYFHNEYYNGSSENTLPPLEDGNGVQLALMMVLERLRREAFHGGQVNVPVVKQLLYGLQTACINLRNTNFDPVLERPMTVNPATFDNEADEAAENNTSKKTPAAATFAGD